MGYAKRFNTSLFGWILQVYLLTAEVRFLTNGRAVRTNFSIEAFLPELLDQLELITAHEEGLMISGQ